MAYFRVEFPDDLMKQITKTASDETSRRILKESIPILAESVRNVIQAEHSDPERGASGELAKSITAFEPYKTKDGTWIVSAAPTGKAKGQMKKGKVFARSKHGTMTSGQALYNSDKLFFLEYGTEKQDPKPVLQKATNIAYSDVVNKMQEVYNREVGEK